MAEYLLSKGVNVNCHDNVGGWTPVYAASFFGWPDLVRLLLRSGADPTIVCKEGKTPLEVVCEAGYRGEHRLVIEALLQDRPEPNVLPPRSVRVPVGVEGGDVGGKAGEGGAKGGGRHHHHSYANTLEAHARGHMAMNSCLPAGSPLVLSPGGGGMGGGRGGGVGGGGVGGAAGGVAGPPPYTEDRLGNRIYFPWELSSADYVLRALGLTREILMQLFRQAVEEGTLLDMPVAGTCGSKNAFRTYLDAFDLLVVAIEHEKALETFVEAKRKKEMEERKEGGKEGGEKENGPGVRCCGVGADVDEGKPLQPLKELLEGLGQTLALQSSPTHHSSREEVSLLLGSLRELAAQVHQPGMAEDIHSLLEQYYTHSESKSLRLRLLRVSQIRGTLEGHERVSAGLPSPALGDGRGGAGAGGEGGSGNEVGELARNGSSGSNSSSGSGGGGSSSVVGARVSSGYSPVGGGGGQGGAGEGELTRAEEKERSKNEFLERYKFLKEHTEDLVLNDDV